MLQQLSVTFNFIIQSALTLVTTTIPPGVVGQAYSFQLQAGNGTPPYIWSATGLPLGLTISPTGLISGTPTEGGSFNTVITVKDSGQ